MCYKHPVLEKYQSTAFQKEESVLKLPKVVIPDLSYSFSD